MTLNRFTIVVGSLVGLAFVASAFADSEFSTEVIKRDGTKSAYRLLPVHHDPLHAPVVARRLQASALFESGLKLPTSHQIAHTSLPAIRDQGFRGTCAYFATVGLMEQYYMTHTTGNKTLRLSEECLVDVRNWMADTATYKGADKPDERPDDAGDLPGSIIQTVKNLGVPTAKAFGNVSCVYNEGDVLGDHQGLDLVLDQYQGLMSSTPSSAQSKPYGKGLSWDQNTSPTITALRTLISKNIPVEVGIVVYNSYVEGDSSDWRYNVAAEASGIAGGHAIILTGYTTTSAGTVFTFKNSWGTTWGKAGYGTMDDNVLTKSWAYDPNFDAVTSLHPASSKL